MRNVHRILAVASLLLHCSAAMSFEVGGIISGTSQENVLATLKQRGFKVTPVEGSGLFGAVRGDEFHTVSFCNGRLTIYTYSVPGGINGFIRRVTQLTAKLGHGDLSSASTETSVGELNTLSITWMTGAERLRVSYVALTKQFDESVSVSHFVSSECQAQLQ